jgi:hypothetical protein
MTTTAALLDSKGSKKSAADSSSVRSAAFERLPDEIIQQLVQQGTSGTM